MNQLLAPSLLVLLAAAPLPPQELEPQWLWGSAEPAEAPRTWFFRTLELPAAAESADLWCSADNAFELWIDCRRTTATRSTTRPRARRTPRSSTRRKTGCTPKRR